jgi:integrase
MDDTNPAERSPALPAAVADRASVAGAAPIWVAQDTSTRDNDGSPALSVEIAGKLTALAEQAAGYAAQSSGVGTRRSYGSAWRGYAAWCAEIGRAPLCGDPGLVALYLTKRAGDGLAVSSIKVARAAIVAAHRLADVPLDGTDRRLAMVMEGIVRDKAGRITRQAAPAVPDVLRRLLAALPAPNTPAAAAPALAARHRAMLLIGFGAALRRSEIVALSVGDVAAETRGLTVLVRRGKTDQHGHGRRIAIWANHRDPGFCAVAAFASWMDFRRNGADFSLGEAPSPASKNATDRPLFCGVTLGGRIMGAPMSDKIVARLIKQACLNAGLDPERFSGHSLRRGLLTNAGDLQLPLVDVMRQSRHKSVDTAMSYIEAGDAWRNNITEPVFR